jgi:hypothetical protein
MRGAPDRENLAGMSQSQEDPPYEHPHIDNEPDKKHGDPVMQEFQRKGAEEQDLDEVGEGETQDGPA